MVGILPLDPHHDQLQYIHHVHLMQRGQNRGVTRLDQVDPTLQRYLFVLTLHF